MFYSFSTNDVIAISYLYLAQKTSLRNHFLYTNHKICTPQVLYIFLSMPPFKIIAERFSVSRAQAASRCFAPLTQTPSQQIINQGGIRMRVFHPAGIGILSFSLSLCQNANFFHQFPGHRQRDFLKFIFPMPYLPQKPPLCLHLA